MTVTAAAKKHLADLAGRPAKADKKVKDGAVSTKTAVKRKPRKPAAKKQVKKAT